MNGYLLDACAVIALLNDEPGADRVDTLLKGKMPVYMSVVNALEVAYDAVRQTGDPAVATKPLRLLMHEGVEFFWSLSEPEFAAAARWKARGRLSLADAIALAVAEIRGLRLISADHHELDPLEAAGLIQVEWIR